MELRIGFCFQKGSDFFTIAWPDLRPWPFPSDLDDEALEAKLYCHQPFTSESQKEPPDISTRTSTQGRHSVSSVREYKQNPEDGYQYNRFHRYS